MRKLKLLAIFLCLNFSFNCFSQILSIDEDSIKAYRTALDCFENAEYGNALKYSEDAILFRKQRVDSEIQFLNSVLSAKRIKAEGDDLYKVLKVLDERGEKKAINLINSYIKFKGESFFNNSISNLLSYISENHAYPEAEKLIADVYKLEGEYDFANDYYEMALRDSQVLDIPEEKYSILYEMADISFLQEDYNTYEVRLLNILVDDPMLKNKSKLNSMIDLIKSDKNDSLEKFFQLYRADSYYQLKAYNLLSNYYFSQGLNQKALEFSSLAVISEFSRLLKILEYRNIDYSYIDLDSFFYELSLHSDLINWANENFVWENLNNLAKFSYSIGSVNFSKALLKQIIRNCPEKYWQKNAVLLLENIN